MSRRIELAVPPKGTRTEWPTYRLTEADLVLLMKACTNGRGSYHPAFTFTTQEKRRLSWLHEYLARARRDFRCISELEAKE
jgi:hypothetical protein